MALGEFPVRPASEEGESLAGYVYRAYDANGHRLPVPLLSAISRAFAKRASLNKLVSVAGSLDIARKAWIPVARMRYQAAAEFPKVLLAGSRLSYCPECLRNQPQHRLIWQVPGVRACPEHGCRLVERCPGCDRFLIWRNCGLDWSCLCGASLLDADSDEASSGELFVARLVRDECLDREGAARDLYVSLAEGAKLLRRIRLLGRGDPLPEAARLLDRAVANNSGVAADLFDALHDPDGDLFVPCSSSLLRIIEWSDDISRSPSLLRENMEIVLREFVAQHRVALPFEKLLLYPTQPLDDRIADLQAFGAWCGCWDPSGGSSCAPREVLFPERRRWGLQDGVIIDIVLELHGAFRRGDAWGPHLAMVRRVTADRPPLVRDAHHVVAALWAWLRPLSVLQLRPYLAELCEYAARGCRP